MIKKVIKRIKLIQLIFELYDLESNDYIFGYKVRKLIRLSNEGKKIKKKEIFKEEIKA